jgi:type II secretory pathway predicted ATPase ExeA
VQAPFYVPLEIYWLLKALITYATQGIWKDWYQRRVHEPAYESAIYDKLKKGPVFLRRTIEHIIPRKPLIDEIRRLITPSEYGGLYTLIIGKPGTGKTSLIKLAVDDMDEPKGIVYVDMPIWCESEASVATAMQKALGWTPDQSIDSSERNYNSSLRWALFEANRSAAASIKETFQVLSRLAIKYKQEYKKVPVLIIDNADKLVQQNQKLLNRFQDYAADAADKEIIEVVFISSEDGIIPRMVGKSIMSIVVENASRFHPLGLAVPSGWHGKSLMRKRRSSCADGHHSLWSSSLYNVLLLPSHLSTLILMVMR